jgi:hypothetical protein
MSHILVAVVTIVPVNPVQHTGNTGLLSTFVMCNSREVLSEAEEKVDLQSYNPQQYCRIANCGANFRRLHIGYLFTDSPSDDTGSSSVSVV